MIIYYFTDIPLALVRRKILVSTSDVLNFCLCTIFVASSRSLLVENSREKGFSSIISDALLLELWHPYPLRNIIPARDVARLHMRMRCACTTSRLRTYAGLGLRSAALVRVLDNFSKFSKYFFCVVAIALGPSQLFTIVAWGRGHAPASYASNQPHPLSLLASRATPTHTKKPIMYADSLQVVRDLPSPDGQWELVKVIGIILL